MVEMAKLELINMLEIIKEAFQIKVKKNVLQLHQIGHFIIWFSAFVGAFKEQNLLWQASDSVQSPLIRFECCLSAHMHPTSSVAQMLDWVKDQKPTEEKTCIQNYFKNFLLHYIPCNCCSTFHDCLFQYYLLLTRKVEPYNLLPLTHLWCCVNWENTSSLCFPLLPRIWRRALKNVITIFLRHRYFSLQVWFAYICLNTCAVAKKQEAHTHRLNLQRRLLFQLGDTKNISVLNVLWISETHLWEALVCVWGSTTNGT